MKLTSKEELFLTLYRSLDPEQQRDYMGALLKRLRAQIHANEVASKVNSGRKLRVTADERVLAAYGLPKPKSPPRARGKAPGKRVKKRREDDIDPSMGDALG